MPVHHADPIVIIFEVIVALLFVGCVIILCLSLQSLYEQRNFWKQFNSIDKK